MEKFTILLSLIFNLFVNTCTVKKFLKIEGNYYFLNIKKVLDCLLFVMRLGNKRILIIDTSDSE